MTGNPSIDKIILAANAVIVVIATGVILYAHMGIKRAPTDRGLNLRNMMEESLNEAQIPTVNFKKMVINLYSRDTRLRFLEVQFNIEPFRSEQTEIVQNHRAFINDTIIDIVSNMSPGELNSVTGRILLEARMKNQINDYMQKKIVKKVYFSRFIIQ